MSGEHHLVYGIVPTELAEVPAGAASCSPLTPGAVQLEALAEASHDSASVLAPPGTLERRYTLAMMLRALKPGATLVALAPKAKGGSRLRGELEAMGCEVSEDARQHFRICTAARPETLNDAVIEAAAAGGPQMIEDLWTQPGIFSWDRLDAGSALLLENLPPLSGRGIDLGCGLGVLSLSVLESPDVREMLLVDIDGRAIAAAKRNVEDKRATFQWQDARQLPAGQFDFVVMNPPFHDAGEQDHGLGQAFVATAAAQLKTGGVCWLTANRHLPYEGVLEKHFSRVVRQAEGMGFKVYEAVK